MAKPFFPPRPEANPKIYVYSIDAPNRKGLLKVGYTIREVSTRIAEQLQTSGVSYKKSKVIDAMRPDGIFFPYKSDLNDKVQKYYAKYGIKEEKQSFIDSLIRPME